jgi:hypothetical protein
MIHIITRLQALKLAYAGSITRSAKVENRLMRTTQSAWEPLTITRAMLQDLDFSPETWHAISLIWSIPSSLGRSDGGSL